MSSPFRLLLALPLLAVSIPVYSAVTHKKEPQLKTPLEYLSSTKSMLLAASDLDFKPIDCELLFLRGNVKGDTACFVSKKEPYALSLLVRPHLDQVAVSTGWDNFGIPGAFYAYKSNPEQTFSIGLKAIVGSRDFVGVREVIGYQSFVTLAMNLTPGRR